MRAGELINEALKTLGVEPSPQSEKDALETLNVMLESVDSRSSWLLHNLKFHCWARRLIR